jgi:hypothetical protein
MVDVDGIVTGCDLAQEWILPWFWHFYRGHNNYPVAFADFGMSPEARGWCRERGILFDPREPMECGNGIPPKAARSWLWKPFAIREAPFRRSLWLDLDTLVERNLFDAFLFCNGRPGATVSVTGSVELWGSFRVGQPFPPGVLMYQGGLFVAERGDPIIADWCRIMKTHLHTNWGDDVLLSYLLHQTGRQLHILPTIFNLPLGMNLGDPVAANMVYARHFMGKGGKAAIAYMIEKGLDTEFDVGELQRIRLQQQDQTTGKGNNEKGGDHE